ncbi:MAG: hypothetical protein RL118_833 [Actinomycetota bacterium]
MLYAVLRPDAFIYTTTFIDVAFEFARAFLFLLLIWIFAKRSFLPGQVDVVTLAALAGVSGLAPLLLPGMQTSARSLLELLQWFATMALAGAALRIVRSKSNFTAAMTAIAILALSLIVQMLSNALLTDDLPGVSARFLGTFILASTLGSVYQLASSLRALMLHRSSSKLENSESFIALRVKRFFAARAGSFALGSLLASALILAEVILVQLVGSLIGASWAFDLSEEFFFFLAATSAVFVTLFVWIPALIANRALAKGKSWDAFFWLSALVSPLIMWIIAEASTDTRGMAPAQYAQQPVQYAPAAPQAHVAPATDTRPCPQCAEDIKAAAKLCKHCGSKVEPIA